MIQVKATITDNFTNLDNFVVLSGEPTITSGRLTGKGAVRHRDQMSTDDFKVTATVGSTGLGRTWLVCSASPNFDSFYAVEINAASIFSIIEGTGLVATTSTSIFGIVMGILGFILGLFEDIIGLFTLQATVTWPVYPTDKISVWWDRKHSIVRVYHRDFQITGLEVPRDAMQHSEGFRYFGVVTGIDWPVPGVEFTSIEAQDV
jgi:hypothetical protein